MCSVHIGYRPKYLLAPHYCLVDKLTMLLNNFCLAWTALACGRRSVRAAISDYVGQIANFSLCRLREHKYIVLYSEWRVIATSVVILFDTMKIQSGVKRVTPWSGRFFWIWSSLLKVSVSISSSSTFARYIFLRIN